MLEPREAQHVSVGARTPESQTLLFPSCPPHPAAASWGSVRAGRLGHWGSLLPSWHDYGEGETLLPRSTAPQFADGKLCGPRVREGPVCTTTPGATPAALLGSSGRRAGPDQPALSRSGNKPGKAPGRPYSAGKWWPGGLRPLSLPTQSHPDARSPCVRWDPVPRRLE